MVPSVLSPFHSFLLLAVEAQGIEPWSECGSRTASTCVGPSFYMSPAR